jgi:cell division protein FtsB
MTDKELKDLVFSLAIESKKTDEQMKKTDEQMKKTSEEITRISQEMKTLQQETQKEIKDSELYIGNIARSQEDIAEEFFVNSISSCPVSPRYGCLV